MNTITIYKTLIKNGNTYLIAVPKKFCKELEEAKFYKITIEGIKDGKDC